MSVPLPLIRDHAAFINIPIDAGLRLQQIAMLRSCLEQSQVAPVHVWMHGPPGSGKTLCLRHVLESASPALGVRAVFVECRPRFTFLAVIEGILREIRPVSRLGPRTREVQVASLRHALAGHRWVIALDDIDMLSASDAAELIHQLVTSAGVSLVCIAANEMLLSRIPEVTRSRLQPHVVQFAAYKAQDLGRLADLAAGAALQAGSLTGAAREKIIERAHGDARRVLGLLRHAALRAQELGSSAIEPQHLRVLNALVPTAGELAMLTAHHRLLWDLVRQRGRVWSKDLAHSYVEGCRRRAMEPMARRSMNRYLGALCQRRLLRREREARKRGWVYSMAESEEQDGPGRE